MAFGKHRRRREAAQAQAAIAAQAAAAAQARQQAMDFAQSESQRVQAAEAARLEEMKRGNDLLAAAQNQAPDAQVIDERDKGLQRRRRGFGLSLTRRAGRAGGLLGRIDAGLGSVMGRE
jgi:hypothetical protein